MNPLPRYVSLAIFVALFIVTFGLGVYTGYENRPETEFVTSLFNKENGASAMVDFAPFWKAWNVINEKYVSTNGPTDQEKVWGAIEGLAGSLGDPYTVFSRPWRRKSLRAIFAATSQASAWKSACARMCLPLLRRLKTRPHFALALSPAIRYWK